MKITGNAINDIMHAVMLTESEAERALSALPDLTPATDEASEDLLLTRLLPSDFVHIRGVARAYIFSRKRLADAKPVIKSFMAELPAGQFGAFPVMVLQEHIQFNRPQKENVQVRMADALVALLLGAGYAAFCCPRGNWAACHDGGLPWLLLGDPPLTGTVAEAPEARKANIPDPDAPKPAPSPLSEDKVLAVAKEAGINAKEQRLVEKLFDKVGADDIKGTTGERLQQGLELVAIHLPQLVAVERFDLRSLALFHRARLETLRPMVVAMIDELPTDFFAASGGGQHISELGRRRAGPNWTTSGEFMEMFAAVSMALGLCQFCVPREDRENAPPLMLKYIVFRGDPTRLPSEFLKYVHRRTTKRADA